MRKGHAVRMFSDLWGSYHLGRGSLCADDWARNGISHKFLYYSRTVSRELDQTMKTMRKIVLLLIALAVLPTPSYCTGSLLEACDGFRESHSRRAVCNQEKLAGSARAHHGTEYIEIDARGQCFKPVIVPSAAFQIWSLLRNRHFTQNPPAEVLSANASAYINHFGARIIRLGRGKRMSIEHPISTGGIVG
jgi:hypothetical protein